MKKALALLLTGAMVLSLAACGNSATTETASTDDSSAAEATTDAAASGEAMVIDNFNVAANYQGIQPGWFGQILKDKFNIELNVISIHIIARFNII